MYQKHCAIFGPPCRFTPRYTSRPDGPLGRPVWRWSRHPSPVSRQVSQVLIQCISRRRLANDDKRRRHLANPITFTGIVEMRKLQMVGQNAINLSRLWASVHQILESCREPFVFIKSFCHLSIARFVPLIH